ncbi:receptor-type tyrosine-protein phosphatase S-like [Acropora millepora]|uniref:receptor-type tyrosine-protein phosphatase S-like n=1 Tax=Acropora millepora TaxID=45264 RepID=UPI001CF424EC|nr:receptor-type tyrosine-protein phosphatase S-like [Acropora millepora]
MSIHVSWKEPFLPNGVISEYWIYFGQQKHDLNQTTVAGSARSRELSALRPFTTYYIKVRAKTTELGDASVLLNATTFEDSPSAPTQFSGNVFGRNASVSWNEPVNKNGIVRKYIIEVYLTKTGEVARRLEINATKKREAMITELTPFTNYTFTIRAFTIKAGEWANFTARTKEEGPGKPRNVTVEATSSTSINVSWKEPLLPNGNISEYWIYFGQQKDDLNQTTVEGSGRSWELIALRPFTTYYIKVRAKTTELGNASALLNATTFEDTCLMPLGIERGRITNAQITASTQYRSPYRSYNARLNSNSGSWIPSSLNAYQWLRVDLGKKTLVTEIKTQGRYNYNQWVTSYRVSYSNDGSNFQTYQENNKDKIFQANRDRHTVVSNVLKPGIHARYIRILPYSWSGRIALRLELVGRLSVFPACLKPLGIEKGSIINAQITASTQHGSPYRSYNARLNSKRGSWIPTSFNTHQWLQVDLGKKTLVTEIKTQGRHDSGQWVTSYRVSYSNDGSNFQTYQENNKDKIFQANRDRQTVVSNVLNPAIHARYIRILPYSWHGHVALRLELLGCLLVVSACLMPLGIERGRITNAQITASTQYGAPYRSYDARLNSKRGSWVPTSLNTHQWLQVDLGKKTSVTEIKTQGRHDYGHWVTSYRVSYIDDGSNFQTYQENNKDKIFQANRDRQTVVSNVLNPAIHARYIRILPYSWHGLIALRLELLGRFSVVPVFFDMDAGAPGKPREVTAKLQSDGSIRVEWKDPEVLNGEIISYQIYFKGKREYDPEFQKSNETKIGSEFRFFEIMERVLDPGTEYKVYVTASTINGEGNRSDSIIINTPAKAPGEPRGVTAKLQSDGSIRVKWKEPEVLNGEIMSYQIYFKGKREYDPKFQKNNKKEILSELRSFDIMERDLDPGTEYTVYMTASTSIGEGNRSDSIIINTPAKAPLPPAQPEVVKEKITTHSVQLKIKPASDSNGKVMFHEIIVEKLGRLRKRESLSLPIEIYGFHEGKKLYIAANLSRESFSASKEFVLGDGKTYGGYENAKLEPGTKYRVYIRGITEANGTLLYGKPVVKNLPSTLEKNDPPIANVSNADKTVGIIAGVLGTLVFIVIIIIAILLYKRSNRERNPNLDAENKPRKRRDFEFKRLISGSKKKVLAVPAEDYPPIPVEQFAKHVAKLHKSDDRGYMIEFNKLDSGQDYESNVALLPENKQKNRYANIIAYDHSRVALTTVDGIEGSDYINASIIAGYNKPNAYIATQGPVPPAFDDFWRMVWEKQSATIIMLTNLQERHQLKCHKYWPDETEDYGDISVMLVKSEHYSDYIIRTFNIKRESEKEEREVKQFHFTVWPDHGVPEYPTALLAFRRRVRAYNPEDAGPMIVHCSAGVGRTGTFVVVDSTLDRIKAENTIEIFNYVAYLRTRRTAMVQTEGQYTFCHDAILESLQCGNTQIYAHDLRITLARMDEVNKNDNMTPFDAQFKTLNKVSPTLNKGCYLVASFAENKVKNRSQDVLAPDFSRVVLTAIDDNEATSYINAVHIPGYKQQHAFIVTHHPLTSTITDFWRMLCEQECSCVVLFDSSEEDGDFPLFWPEDESTYDDMITVKRLSASGSSVDNLKANYDQAQVAETSFKATDLRTPENSLRIKMFKFSSWVEEEKIPAYSALIALIAKVEKWQQHSGNGPIAVVCSDGLGRSGTFCALYSVLERLKIEQVVDVFQAIKAMRIPRPGLVKSAAEYRFIHFAIQEYLSAFDDYANFKP